MHPDDRQQLMEDLRRTATQWVAAGFQTAESMHENLLDMACDEGLEDDAALEKMVDSFIEEARRQQLAAQTNWPAITDFDRLEVAFAALEEQGIVARHDFTCCGTCGASEIHAEISQERDSGRTIHGYVFYHQQDTESAVDGYGLHFNYGPVMSGQLNYEDVAKVLVAALTGAGLAVEWNGNTNQRVKAALDWKRRLA
jgi:hypothetical protein